MIVEQETKTRINDSNRNGDLAWDQNRNSLTSDLVLAESKIIHNKFEGLIHAGQKVLLSDKHSIGRVTKLMPGAAGEISYLVVRTAHFWGHQKTSPVGFISDVTPDGVFLSINRKEFMKLTDYKTDEFIVNEVGVALWNDEILRITVVPGIDVQAKNGVVTLTGYIMGMLNQERIENTLKKVKGILSVTMDFVADDKLLLKVVEALIPIGRVNGNHVSAKVENGVAMLNGKVINTETRDLAEKYAADVPRVRGVIDNIVVPEINLIAEDQRFLQPAIGEKIFFQDGLFGLVRQVVINPNNRRVVDMIILGQFPVKEIKPGLMRTGENMMERLVVIPVSAIRYLTSESGFLFIDSSETTQYHDFVPESFINPGADWAAPYPYRREDIRLLATQGI